MAMINCPECGHEISDKAKKCIHCGKNFEETIVKLCSECGAELSVDAEICDKCGCPVISEEEQERIIKKEKVQQNRKKFLIGGVSVIALIIVIIIGINIGKTNKEKNAYNEYIDILQLAEATMLEGAAESEDVCDLTARVWRNAIYEEADSSTDKYVFPNGEYVEDFNTALFLLFLDESTVAKTDSISKNQETVKGYIKNLQNPPEGLETCYETITDLYDAYGTLTDLAVNPTGNLNSFTEASNNAISDFSTAYKKLDSQIPEKN